MIMEQQNADGSLRFVSALSGNTAFYVDPSSNNMATKIASLTMGEAGTALISTAVNAAGTIYVPGDTITLTHAGITVKPVVTVTHVKLVSATIHASGGGTGYGNAQTFNVTVAGGTAGTAAVISVTSNAGGVVTTVNSVGTAGDYTVLPTTILGNLCTGDDGSDHGTGLALDLVFGVKTVSVASAAIDGNPSSFTQSSTTSAAGTGATFNTNVFTLTKNLFILPAGSIPTDVRVYSSTASNAGTTATIAVGITGTVTQYTPTLDVKGASGKISAAAATNLWGTALSSATQVIGTHVETGTVSTDATTRYIAMDFYLP